MKLLLFAALALADPTLRHDGKLTGPGLVEYEFFNKAEETKSVSIAGVVMGSHRETGVPAILKRSRDHVVIPTNTTKFNLVVTHEDFLTWSETYNKLTIAFIFSDAAEASNWEYRNLLTQRDVASTPSGIHRIKGAFHSKDVKKR